MSRQQSNEPHYAAEDEIDLVALFLILWKRKLLIVAIPIVFLFLAGGYVFLKKDTYTYVTAFQIGINVETMGGQTTKKNIESSESAKVKLDEVYIPSAVEKLFARENGLRLKANAESLKNSEILLLSSVGLLSQQQIIKDFHREIVAPLMAEHLKLVAASMREFELSAERAQLKLKELQDPQIYQFTEKSLQREISAAEAELLRLGDEKKLFQTNKDRLFKTQDILKAQIKKIENNLEFAYKKRSPASDEADDEARALTFLMINNQIEQNENRLAGLQERLYIKIEDQKQILENKISENQRSINLQREKISALQSKLVKLQAERKNNIAQQENILADIQNKMNFFQNSRTLEVAQRGLDKDGPGKIVILVLSLAIGLMGGIMVAFIAEFMSKVRQQQMQLSGEET